MTVIAPQLDGLRSRVARYYSGKIERHGPTPAGVDWPCGPTQQLRFVQLLRLAEWDAPCSLDDWGCGYGALLGFMAERHPAAQVDYLGIDLSTAMVRTAGALWRRQRAVRFHVGERSPRVADYAVSSGIFNVRMDEPLPLWEAFVAQTLRDIAACTRVGFAANFLAPLPHGMPGKPELYRVGPAQWLDFCERELGTRVTLLDRYGMREFTLLARH